VAEPAPAWPAATVVVLRPSDSGPEVLLLQRSQKSGFFPSAWVFPGGGVDDVDRSLLTRGAVVGLPMSATCFAVAAVRECLEEAGVWLGEGVVPPDLRDRLNAGTATMTDAPGLVPDLDRLEQWAHWVTPVGRPRRFDTRFFVAVVSPEDVAHAAHDSRETVDSQWLRPRDALAAEGVFLAPPTFRTLEELAAVIDEVGGDLPDLMSRARGRLVTAIEPRAARGEDGGAVLTLPGHSTFPSDTPAPGPKRIVWRGSGWRSEA
jgi:8-oxo-dGTP pyrophosphatase MutT (NUDIX family)